jgi:hypothetical protein
MRVIDDREFYALGNGLAIYNKNCLAVSSFAQTPLKPFFGPKFEIFQARITKFDAIQ